MIWHNRGTYAELLKQAKAAAHNSYSPYSKFPVGAAGLFLDERGRHVFASGSNVENASFGLTICAERVVTFSAVSQGYSTLVAIAVIYPLLNEDDPPAASMPCGACRQVIAEFALPTSLIIVDGVGQFRSEELLPKAFLLRRS